MSCFHRRDRRMITRMRTPGTLGPDADADARSPDDRPGNNAAILDVKARATEIETVVLQRHAHRQREVARTAAQVVDRDRPFGTTTPPGRSRATAAHRRYA